MDPEPPHPRESSIRVVTMVSPSHTCIGYFAPHLLRGYIIV